MASKVGPILSVVGGLILVLYRVVVMTQENPSNPVVILAKGIQLTFVILLAALCILGAILVLVDVKIKKFGIYIALIGAIGGIVGLFINIPFDTGGVIPYYQNLSSTFYFVDISLMLIGAILMFVKSRK